MSTAQKIQTLQDEHNTPLDYQDEIMSLRTLSGSAKVLLLCLVKRSGYKGYCWPGIECLCGWTGLSETQVHYHLKKLEQKGFIRITRRSGQSNIYQLTGFIDESREGVRVSAPIKGLYKNKKTCTEQKTNVVCLQPPEQQKHKPEVAQGEHVLDQRNQLRGNTPARAVPLPKVTEQVKPEQVKAQSSPRKPIPHYLIAEILKLTNDKKSFGLWFRFVTKCSEQTVYHCLRLLNQSLMDESRPVQNRGAYFVTILKCECPELFQEREYSPPVQTSRIKQPIEPVIHEPTVTRTPEPSVERNDELNKSGLADIKAILFGRKSPDRPDANRLNRSRITRVLGSGNSNPRGIV